MDRLSRLFNDIDKVIDDTRFESKQVINELLYLTNKRIHNAQDDLARIHKEARETINKLTEDYESDLDEIEKIEEE